MLSGHVLVSSGEELGVRELMFSLALLANHHNFGATLSAIHKDQWLIELFLTALRQNLEGKTFVRITKNVLGIQIAIELLHTFNLKGS